MSRKKTLDIEQSNPDFSACLLGWYDVHRRDLPWRTHPTLRPRIDPYAVLVSEFMLQQTQVATVTPYFLRFMGQFPTAASLAAADTQQVLRLWQGLGYYARARNLQKAAKMIVDQFAGSLPKSMEALLNLPGVGRYTAGAIASIAFDKPTPILDGNVARVLSRLKNWRDDPRPPASAAKRWLLAEKILPAKRIGDFNSALMELGATICTPRNPQCEICPVQKFCRGYAAGDPQSIPPPKKPIATPLNQRWTFCIQHRGRWLIEQRPNTGRWASLWQFPTAPMKPNESPESVAKSIGLQITNAISLGQISHALTHRKYEFQIIQATLKNRIEIYPKNSSSNRRWIRPDELSEFPLPRPHLKIAAILKEAVNHTQLF